jgi:phosphatidate cytidylyltransferase
VTTGDEEQPDGGLDGGGSPDASGSEPTLNDGLRTRLVAALVLIPVSLGFVYAGGWYFALSLVFVVCLMAFEWNRLVLGLATNRLVAYVVVYTGFMAGALGLGLADYWGFALLLTGLAGATVYFMAVQQKVKANWALIGVPYIFLPMLSFIWLRAGVGGEHGIATVVWILLVVWGSDSGGYIVGKSVGGPKLAPRISPNKTWSGFGGGLALAMLAGLVMSLWAGAGSTLTLILVSAGLSAISQVGDLVESSVKRHFGVKDFSSIIPGHGGVLDRFDGLLFTLMAAGALKVFHDGSLLVWGQI